ncbi:MAG: anhydro-N-acetylmuramic acid kinase [Candidatus Eisenbacteria bacterium]
MTTTTKPRRVIGLLSGTSMDGVDAALVSVRGGGLRARVELEAFRTFPFSKNDRERLAAMAGPGPKEAEERARLHVRMGEILARGARRVAEPEGGLGRVDLIGSHGQTLLHRPARREGASVQIGCGAVIAARTGVPTVYDFRSADIAAGGEGAPLLPLADYLLFRSRRVTRVLLNLGGIGNLTVLPAGGAWEDTTAYDTGPGNGILDRLASLVTGGRARFDRDGRMAARGIPDGALLRELERHPFFRRRGPKSTGTSTFGDDMARRILSEGARRRRSPEDMLATATAFTARTAGREIRRWAPEDGVVYLCGGGAKNRTLARMIGEEIAPRSLLPVDDLGIPADAREAVGFALLAVEFMDGRHYDMERITGARGVAPLGVLAPGPRPYRISPAGGGISR